MKETVFTNENYIGYTFQKEHIEGIYVYIVFANGINIESYINNNTIVNMKLLNEDIIYNKPYISPTIFEENVIKNNEYEHFINEVIKILKLKEIIK